MTASRLLAAFAVPLGAVVAAYLGIPRIGEVPASLMGLQTYAPHISIGLGAALSLGFARGRTFFALVLIALGYAGVQSFPGTPIYNAITLALPINLAILAWQREKGLLNRQALRQALMLAGEIVMVLVLCGIFPASVDRTVQNVFFSNLVIAPLGQSTVIVTALSAIVACASWFYSREAVALGLAAAAVAFSFAAHAIAHAETASLFVATAALVLAIAVLQDIFHMAFRDPLTGLMSRRALEEDLARLGRRYAIAMVDVDHFKRVNDDHGHDTGDQILKMVARKLAATGGKPRAYRYGGEEFALVFPGVDASVVCEQLDAIRNAIATDPFRLRTADRNTTGRSARKRKARNTRTLNVTVSIGVAQPNARNPEPHAVLAMADKALYRAKKRGRNNVCRYDAKR